MREVFEVLEMPLPGSSDKRWQLGLHEGGTTLHF